MGDNYNQGVIEFEKKKYQKALEYFLKCDVKVYNNLEYFIGVCHFKIGDLEKAENALMKITNEKKKNWKYYLTFGNVKCALGKTKEALKLFLKGTETLGENYEIISMISEEFLEFAKGIGGCYCQLGLYSIALRHLKKAYIFYSLDSKFKIPDNNTLRNLLLCLNKINEYKQTLEIIKLYKLEINRQTANEFFWMEEKAEALYGLNLIQPCIEFCESMRQKYEYLNYYIAKCYLVTAKANQANELIDKVIEKYPKAAEPLFLKGKIEEELHLDDRKIIQKFSKCIKLDPYDIKYYIELIKKYLNYCELESAIKVVEYADKHIDDEYQLNYNLLYLLYKTECLCRVKRRAEANKLLVFIRNTLRNRKIRECFTKEDLIEIFSRYFEIYHECKYLYSKDLTKNLNVVLGRGGFGIVYEGKLKNKDVAIKEFIFSPNFGKNLKYTYDSLESVFMEISALELLSTECEYILPIESIFYEDNRTHLMLITPLMKGGNYAALLKNMEIKLSIKARIDILIQIAYSIKHFQSFNPPFVHHDIKASNILLGDNYNDKSNKVYLCDFGMIQELGVKTKGFTPCYAAPELLKDEAYGIQSDIFSFGVLIWESFTRELPFYRNKVDEIINKVCTGERVRMDKLKADTPMEVREIIIKCFEGNPDKRPKIDDIINVLKKIYKKIK